MLTNRTILLELFACILIPALLAWLVTGLVIRYAERLGLIHQPNHRSSHTKITPHGGGIAIVFSTGIFSIWLLGSNSVSLSNYWLAISLAIIVAIKGLLDDIFHLPASLRFLIQTAACTALVFSLYTLPINGLEAISNLPNWLSFGLIILAGVWWLNLFNFMDGIDGIAASQAIFMLLGSASIIALQNPLLINTDIWSWIICLAATTLGFLHFNWSPAKIFMGDTGSMFLAFMIFFLALLTTNLKWIGYSSWIILGALFISDASITLARRLLNGQKVTQAHRSHAYQRLARAWKSHSAVTTFSIFINLCWLFPLAYLATYLPELGWRLTILAYTPLLVGIYHLGAGRPDYA